MASWKKVVVSGSDAHLHHITASHNLVVSGTIEHIGTKAEFGPVTSSGAVRATLPTTSQTSYVVVDSSGNFGKRSLPTIPSAANDNTITITAGDGLKSSNDVTQFTTNDSTDIEVGLAVDVSDFAGTGLKDEGSENLAVDLNGVSAGAIATGDSIVFIDADDSNATKKEALADVVTLLAGDGIKNGSNKFAIDVDVIAGVGLTADNTNEELDVTAAQTGITSVLNTSLVVGRDADNQVKFGTDNKIIFEVGGSDNITFDANGHITASGISVSGRVSASAGITGSLQGTASFVESLTGVTLADGKILIGDASNEVSAQTLSGAVSITRGGVASLGANSVDSDQYVDGSIDTVHIANNAVTGDKLADSVTIAQNLTVAGNLVVEGDTVQQQVANLLVEDRFILLNSGSSSGDGGIIVSTESDGVTGAALGYDDSLSRWVIAPSGEVGSTDTAFAANDNTQMLVAVSHSSGAPSGNPDSFGADAASRVGLMFVDTSNEDIYIFS